MSRMGMCIVICCTPLQEERALADRTCVHRLPVTTPSNPGDHADLPKAPIAGAHNGAVRIKNPSSTLPRTVEHDAQYVRNPSKCVWMTRHLSFVRNATCTRMASTIRSLHCH